MEREAMAAAFKFEEAIQAGYDIDKVKSFCDYADYVLDLKERNGLAPTTIERYRAMLPRINDAIGHLKLTQIRPQHLNDFYKTLSENLLDRYMAQIRKLLLCQAFSFSGFPHFLP